MILRIFFLLSFSAIYAEGINDLRSTENIENQRNGTDNPLNSSLESQDIDQFKKLKDEIKIARDKKLRERLQGDPDTRPPPSATSNTSENYFTDKLNEKLGEASKKSGKNLNRNTSRSTGNEEGIEIGGENDESEPEQDGFYSSQLVAPPSKIEKVFQGQFPNEISKNIEQFGYSLFQNTRNDFSPLEDTPISPDYIIGPGDTFTVNISGADNFSKLVTVRRNGTILLPRVGALKVWGDSYKDMTKKIEKRLSAYYSGIKVDFNFERIRSIDIFVVGEVSKPGSYSVPSTSTALNVLFHAGGPTKNGSLRNIKLLRQNKEIGSVDLYDFLISGKNNTQALQSQDVILVPIIGKVAALAGQVKRPAIYEILDNTTLYDMLEIAGGLSFTGEAGRLELQRVQAHQERITKDFPLDSWTNLQSNDSLRAKLKDAVLDGDLIKIFPVQPIIKKTVFLRGHVKRPGSYEFRNGMRVKDLIPNLEGLKPEPYTDYIQVVRVAPPKDERSALFVNLQKALDGDPIENIQLQDRDQVFVYSKDELQMRDRVEILGKVNRPGSYFYFDGMTIKDLILMGGNLSQDAYLGAFEIARYDLNDESLNSHRIRGNLKDVISGSANANVLLKPRDKIFIQGISNWQTKNQISITGEVKFPGTYTFLPGERLSSAIDRSGGYLNQAFLKGAIFSRKSVKEIQQKSLKQQISQLEESILQESIRPSQGSSAEDIRAFQEAAASRKALLRNLEEAEVTGRMVIRLSEMKDFKNGLYDFALEPEDSLHVPIQPSTVTVMGEVYNQTSLIFVEGKDVQYYLEKSGGPTINADVDSIFVVKSDGSVISKRQNRGFLLKNFFQMEIERGDTILVPKDISRYSWLATTKDITDIIFKIASTTGITIQAFK